MKPCKHCLRVLPLDVFYKHKAMADGHINVCKGCRDGYVKSWQERNVSRRREISRESRRRNYDAGKNAAGFADWYAKAKDNGAYARMVVRGSARRAIEKRATPAWANQFFMAEIYDLAHRRTKVTGTLWHTDHIIPLKSDLVCGLHVEHNLACIPAFTNCSKHNRSWPNMPGN